VEHFTAVEQRQLRANQSLHIISKLMYVYKITLYQCVKGKSIPVTGRGGP
jgi:hypothetical protein